MTLDFQQLQEQVKAYGNNAQLREPLLHGQRQAARALLEDLAQSQAELRAKVERTAARFDPNLRCALPGSDPLNASLPAPEPPTGGTIIAADGSQINPDRHAPVDFSLINVGAILLKQGSAAPPRTVVQSELLYEEPSDQARQPMTEGLLALLRDLKEREVFLELVEEGVEVPVITFTDGPLELWLGREGRRSDTYGDHLERYLQVLEGLHEQDITTAGYVDKPAANLVVRLLEIGLTPEDELPDIRQNTPLFGVTDLFLFSQTLAPGQRSAVYGLQSRTIAEYPANISVRFFYLNVGREGSPDLARVEIPAWVAEVPARVDALHAVLLQQCRALGNRSYPYLLHRAHEAALVTRDERDQVTQMIALELRRRGLAVGRASQKQSLKDLAGQARL